MESISILILVTVKILIQFRIQQVRRQYMDGSGVNVLQIKTMGEHEVEDLGKQMVEMIGIGIQADKDSLMWSKWQ